MKQNSTYKLLIGGMFVALCAALVWGSGILGTLGGPEEKPASCADEACKDACEPKKAKTPPSGCADEGCKEACGEKKTEEPRPGCADEGCKDACEQEKTEEPGLPPGNGGGDGEPEAFRKTCEHGVILADCDNCRFSGGIVKVDPSVEAALITSGRAEARTLEHTLKLTGEIQFDPTRTVEVSPAGSGVVITVTRRLGQQVAVGETLAVIRSSQLGEAKAAFIEAHARFALAEKNAEREKGLVEKGISGKAEYQDALRELTAARGHLAAADKRLRIFGLGDAEIAAVQGGANGNRFADLHVRAPLTGRIVKQNIAQGRYVETRESLYTVSDPSNLWVWCDLYERDLGLLQKAIAARGRVDATLRVVAFGETNFAGVIDLIGSEVDRRTRTVKVRVQVPNGDGRLKPGMFATVAVRIVENTQALLVPQSAVLRDAGCTFVFEKRPPDYWVRRNIQVAATADGYVEVLEGLRPGATIATGGAFALKSDVLRDKMGAG